MTKIHKNTNGFSAIEVLLVIVVLAIVGVGGYFVAKHVDTKKTAVATTSSTPKSTTTDPYAGWKSYCDSNGNCFKYPADWTPVTSGPTGPEPGNFRNSQQTLKLISGITNSVGTLTDPALWYTNKVDSLSNATNKYKIWGGYLSAPGVYVPQYAVVDSSLVGDSGLAIGQTKSTTDGTYISYTINNGTQHYSLDVFAISNDSFSKSKADDWFNTADAKTALQIVQSYYKQ